MLNAQPAEDTLDAAGATTATSNVPSEGAKVGKAAKKTGRGTLAKADAAKKKPGQPTSQQLQKKLAPFHVQE